MSAGGIRQQPNTGLRVKIEGTRARQTPKTDFGSVFKSGAGKDADVALSGANVAAPFIPGGAVVSAAISGALSGLGVHQNRQEARNVDENLTALTDTDDDVVVAGEKRGVPAALAHELTHVVQQSPYRINSALKAHAHLKRSR